jgi:trans-2,3-dihydro-3-hydroxyanthranilate isomerase
MTKISYRLLNVFAETAFGGNPLAVIEDASALTDREMQLVARQFNLSETTFILPSNKAAAQIRIFTTSYEMDFAGHPTLGSAQVIRELFHLGDAFKIEMKAGLIPVSAIQNHWTLFANTPRYRPMLASRPELAAMLNLPEVAIAGDPLWVDCGTEQLMIPLASAEFIHACRPDLRLMAKYSKNLSGQAKTYVFAKTLGGFESRYFSMADENSINEDPGTGSACANLGAWWLSTEGDKPLTAKINQGTFIQRPNVLSLNVAKGEIQVGGRVIEIGRGELQW